MPNSPIRIGCSGIYVPLRDYTYRSEGVNFDYFFIKQKLWYIGAQFQYVNQASNNDMFYVGQTFEYKTYIVSTLRTYNVYGGYDVSWKRLIVSPQLGIAYGKSIFYEYAKMVETTNKTTIIVPTYNKEKVSIAPHIRVCFGIRI